VVAERAAGAPALAVLALALAGCGGGWRAPDLPPAPPPREVPPRPTTPHTPAPPPDDLEQAPIDQPAPDVGAEPAPPAPRSAPRGVAAESNYPIPRVWEWTLANGVHVWFRRSAGAPGQFVLRAAAPGGWRGLTGGAPADGTAPAGLRTSLRADETVAAAAGALSELPAVIDALAGLMAGTVPAGAVLSPDAALDAALAGASPDARAAPAALAARFGRPSDFRVVISGDVAPDTLIAMVGPRLSRLRTAPEASIVTADSAAALHAPRPRAIRHAGDGRGRRALVAFRGAATGPTAERRPDQVRAGADVLAHALLAAADAGPGARRSVAVDGRSITLIFEIAGDPEEATERVLRAAGALALADAAVSRARGAAVDAHRREVQRPEGWIEWLRFLSLSAADPRAAQEYAATLRAVPVERVRALAQVLLDPARAAVVHVAD